MIVEATRSDGRAEIWLQDGDTPTANDALRLQLNQDDFNISFNGTGGAELQVEKAGNLRIGRGDLILSAGDVIVLGTTLNVPDYVFAPDYRLMPLSDVEAFIAENSHLPHIPSAAAVEAEGLDMAGMQMALLRTVEELMLHTFEQQALIDALRPDLSLLQEQR